MSLSAFEISLSLAVEETEELPPPFSNIPAILCDRSYLATQLGNNSLVYISRLVVRQIFF